MWQKLVKNSHMKPHIWQKCLIVIIFNIIKLFVNCVCLCSVNRHTCVSARLCLFLCCISGTVNYTGQGPIAAGQ